MRIDELLKEKRERSVAVAWEDDRKGFAGVFLAISRDGGKSWRETRVDQNPAERADVRGMRLAWGPSEALHAVWETQKRLTVGDVETSVHYRRLPVGAAPGS